MGFISRLQHLEFFGFPENFHHFWHEWIFSDFLKISTDKPQYDTFFDYWIIEEVTPILITPD